MHFFFFRALITKQVEWKLQEAERWTVLLIPLSLEWYLGLEMLKHFFLPDCPINTSIRMILHSSGPTCLFLHLFVGSASAFQTRPCLRITWGGEGRLLKHRSMAHNLSFCFRRHGGGAANVAPEQGAGCCWCCDPGTALLEHEKDPCQLSPPAMSLLHTLSSRPHCPFCSCLQHHRKPAGLALRPFRRAILWDAAPEAEGFHLPSPRILCCSWQALLTVAGVGGCLWNIMHSNYVKSCEGMLFIFGPCQALSQCFLRRIEHIGVISTEGCGWPQIVKWGSVVADASVGHWLIV